ncbi:MAG TPA: L-rhamnose mutarotase [Phycisphaerales bacterium]|nr:L-rhamnose mutarotase [Phycisphaerales bacterium]
MNGLKRIGMTALFVTLIVVMAGCQRAKVKRVGMVVGIKPEKIAEYKKLHADSNPGVRDLLNKYHMRNFSIYLHEIDGKYYEFGYYEYTGKNFEADMAKLDAEPRNKEWLAICDPMQIPLKGYDSWAGMELVYRND